MCKLKIRKYLGKQENKWIEMMFKNINEGLEVFDFADIGAWGRTRTGTLFLTVDFESTASTDFATQAFERAFLKLYKTLQARFTWTVFLSTY